VHKQQPLPCHIRPPFGIGNSVFVTINLWGNTIIPLIYGSPTFAMVVILIVTIHTVIGYTAILTHHI